MDQRPRRRLRRCLLSLLATSFLATGLMSTPATAADPVAADPVTREIPPQEPGVTLRVFDVQVPLEKICVLKPAQTPNVDKLMPVIDWSSTDDFGGIGDNFVSE
ncbi:family 16 glycoside hydrolase, partial [Streptomyces niveus]